MEAVLYVIQQTQIKEYDLLELSGTSQTIQETYFSAFERGGQWHYECPAPIVVNKMSSVKGTLNVDDVLYLCRQTGAYALVLPRPHGLAVSIEWKGKPILFGRRSDCDIVSSCNVVSGHHCSFVCKDGEWYVKDEGSRNGIWLDHWRIQSGCIKEGKTLIAGPYHICTQDGNLVFLQTNDELKFHVETKKKNSVKEKDAHTPEYPYFSRSPRLTEELPKLELNLETAPSIGEKPGANMIGMSFNLQMLALNAGFQGVRYLLGKRKYNKKEQQREEIYRAYLANVEEQLKQHANQQRTILQNKFPDQIQCESIVRIQLEENILLNKHIRLWERRPTDDDFLAFRVGTGEVSAAAKVHLPQQSLTLNKDEYADCPKEIADHYRIVSDVPLIINLAKDRAVGLIGSRESTMAMFQSIAVQAATLCSYTELKIIALYPKEEEESWRWMRWLLHCSDAGRNVRFLAGTKDEASAVLEGINEEMRRRMEAKKEYYSGRSVLRLPFFLVLATDSSYLNGMPLWDALMTDGEKLGVGAVFVGETSGDLPGCVSQILELNGAEGKLYHKDSSETRQKIHPEYALMDVKQLEEFARCLAPVRLRGVQAGQNLPGMVSLLEGLHVRKVSELDFEEYWSSSDSQRSLAVPIGVRENGENFYFDIHEKAHGPHGVIAGMTGSGKTEMIQTWITSMAVQFSPEDVNFVLIDFKGTGLIDPFVSMPHLAGTISNLDHDIDRNLIALKSELNRRMGLLSRYGAKSILEYKKMQKEHRDMEMLPFLILVLDEFADFKKQFPDFMGTIDTILREGRSIGVYTILMAQNPNGIITDQVNANVGFRWCLKVASESASREILGKNDAAAILNPGRAYVKANTPRGEVYELIQSFFSGAAYQSDVKKTDAKATVNLVELNGRRIKGAVKKEQKKKGQKTQLEAVMEALTEYASSHAVRQARKIWQEKLPNEILLFSLLEKRAEASVSKEETKNEHKETRSQNKENRSIESPVAVLGRMDDPAAQRQDILTHSFWEEGNLAVVGSGQTGKTTFLQTLLVSMCMSYQPDEVQFYLVDIKGFGLRSLEIFPHVGAAAGDEDEEELQEMTQTIIEELDRRKQLFREEGAGSMYAYTEGTGQHLSTIILMIDQVNLANDLPFSVTQAWNRIAREGAARGIYLAVSYSGVSGISGQLTQNIRRFFALQLPDKSDYMTCLGVRPNNTVEQIAGRGLFKKDARLLTFQTAIPGEETSDTKRIRHLREVAKEMAAAWKSAHPVIPNVPQWLLYGSVQKEGITDQICFGKELAKQTPVFLSTDSQGLLISHQGKGELAVLTCLMREVQRTKGSLWLYTDRKDSFGQAIFCCDAVYDTAADLEMALDPFASELRRRKQENAGNYPVMCILIDGFKRFMEEAQLNLLLRLEAYVSLGKGLSVLIAVSDTAENLEWCKNEEAKNVLMATLLSLRHALALSGKPAQHMVLRGMLFEQGTTSCKETEGFWISETGSKHIQCMSGEEL